MRRNRSNRNRPALGRVSAFTLVELLVVMSIIAILVVAVAIAGSTLVAKAKSQATTGVLTLVRDSLEEFRREQTAHPTVVKAKWGVGRTYEDRYGLYPPDELEVFGKNGLQDGSNPAKLRIARGADVIVPDGTQTSGFATLRFATDLLPDQLAYEHRDLAAMILTIELYGDTSATILDQIDDRYRTDGAFKIDNGKKVPTQFLDRNDDGKFDPASDHQIRYIVDDWGLPLSYLAQRDFPRSSPPTPVASNNYPSWNRASTEMIRLNGGVPIIMSYGANGKEQCTQEMMDTTARESLVADWSELVLTSAKQNKIDHPLNADNVYADSGLAEKLAGGK